MLVVSRVYQLAEYLVGSLVYYWVERSADKKVD